MARLTIQFRDMFMLVMHSNGAIVLLPSDGHKASLTYEDQTVHLVQHQVNLLDAEGNVIWGHRPVQPARTHLPHMNDAFGCRTVLRSGLIGGPIPHDLNARIVLAGQGSSLDAPRAQRYAGASGVHWYFKNKTRPHWQQLTDTLIFRMPFQTDLTLRCWNASDTTDLKIPASRNASVWIENSDGTTGGPPSPDTYSLSDFAILYALVRGDCEAPEVPIGYYPGEGDFFPSGVQGIRSEEEPICGGGESDPPDPPEPPPTPTP